MISRYVRSALVVVVILESPADDLDKVPVYSA